ncbi:MAG: SHD1 domain-containing protein [Planctomycetota bacterium]|nr:SHD1 domain-containing protein [Planctomycetota bacterium]
MILCGGQSPARTWTDSTGKHKIEGEFVKLAEGQVDIRRDDGKLVRIPLEKLSQADREYARRQAASADLNPFQSQDSSDQQKPVAKPSQTGAGRRILEGQQHQDAVTLLKQAFDDFPIKCLAVTPEKPRIDAAGADGRTNVTVPVTVTVDPARYRAFDTSVRNILNAMTARKSSYTFDVSDGYKGAEFSIVKKDDGIPLYAFLNQTTGLSELHFKSDANRREGVFGVGLYDLDKSSSRKVTWTVFEPGPECCNFFKAMVTAPKSLEMTVTLRDAGGKFIEDLSFPTEVSDGKVEPRKGTNNSPPVVLEGISPPKESLYYRVSTSLSLQGVNMAGDGYKMSNGVNSFPEFVPLFPIGPLFYYRFSSTSYYCLSPEIRFAVKFQDLELEAVGRISRVECTLNRPSR